MPEARTISAKQTEEERKALLTSLDNENPNAPDPDADEEDEGTDPDDQGSDGDQADDSSNDDSSQDDSQADDSTSDDADDSDSEEADQSESQPPKKPANQNEPDYKKKFSESSAEAQSLALRKKAYEDKIAEARALPEPTVEELKEKYPDWDELSPTVQQMARESLHNKKKNALIETIADQQKADEEYYGKADAFAVDPENVKRFPALEGQEELFKKFASKESRRGLDFEDIAVIFSGVYPKSRRASNRSLFPRNGASNDKKKPASKHMDAATASNLRITSPKAYNEMVRSGRIKPAQFAD